MALAEFQEEHGYEISELRDKIEKVSVQQRSVAEEGSRLSTEVLAAQVTANQVQGHFELLKDKIRSLESQLEDIQGPDPMDLVLGEIAQLRCLCESLQNQLRAVVQQTEEQIIRKPSTAADNVGYAGAPENTLGVPASGLVTLAGVCDLPLFVTASHTFSLFTEELDKVRRRAMSGIKPAVLRLNVQVLISGE